MCEIEFAKRLSDQEVLLLLKRSVRDERQQTAQVLVHLGEVDARKLYRDEGYSSMFVYAVQALQMTEPEAALRIRVSRFIRRFPHVLEMLVRGELNLTAIGLLAPVVTEQNLELLDLAKHKSKNDVAELVAKHFPRPDAPSQIRKLPTARPLEVEAPCGTGSPLLDLASTNLLGLEAVPVSVSPPAMSGAVAFARAVVRAQVPSVSVQAPLSEDRFKVQFTASRRVNDKLTRAKELLRREVRPGDLEAVVERALDLLIADQEKKLFGVTAKPRASAPRRKPACKRTCDGASVGQSASVATPPASRTNSRYVPRELRRQVYARDEGRCAFTASNGTRCTARDRLEFHHILAFALGGWMELDNIELRCRAHNMLEAERDFGRDKITQRIESRRSAKQASVRVQQRPDAAQIAITTSEMLAHQSDLNEKTHASEATAASSGR
jgi:hypothetical protein